MEPSETYGTLRNDGRSGHHRAELEKTIAAIAARIESLKAEIAPDPDREPAQLGGS